jgi:putative cofactor-binding repeat protein
MKHIFGALTGACLLAPSAFATTPTGNTLYVANNGVDSPVCGALATPCRSISQGIANAAVGDTLLVKPGRYGDLNLDGVLASPGEESGPSTPGSQGGVRVTKRLTILSTAGAEATIIDVNGGSPAAVELVADGVRFGERNAGFTLLGGREYGLYTEAAANVVIAGNLARNAPFAGFILRSKGTLEARNNTMTGSGAIGLWIISNASSSAVVSNNFAFGNATGIAVNGEGPIRISGNEVSGNENGFSIDYGPSRIAQNQIVQNRFGLMINGGNGGGAHAPVVTRNNFIGNRQLGIYVLPGPAGNNLKIRENNLYGHDPCALGSQAGQVVDARNNFWGAATGPSFQDPADGDCSAPGDTITTPFATSEFDVR